MTQTQTLKSVRYINEYAGNYAGSYAGNYASDYVPSQGQAGAGYPSLVSMFTLQDKWGFPSIRGPSLGVPAMRSIEYWGTH